MNEKMFKQDAKSIVDLAFDTKLFNDSITRDQMKVFEELIEFILSSKFESYKRAEKLFESIKDRNEYNT